MSVTMSKADGVTVFTLNTDPQSSCPPICQIFKGLCYSPVLCSVSQHLKKVQGMSQSVLGALHIMVGLLNIGLGAILCSSRDGSAFEMDFYLYPYWLGGLFIFFGSMCILSEKCPSRCLVFLNVILNLLGVVFAIVAIVLYAINLAQIQFWWMCRDYNTYYRRRSDYRTTTPSPDQLHHKEMIDSRCLEGKELLIMLTQSINAVLIVLSVLELCVTISSAVLGIKALRNKEKQEYQSADDPEQFKPLLEEVTSDPSV